MVYFQGTQPNTDKSDIDRSYGTCSIWMNNTWYGLTKEPKQQDILKFSNGQATLISMLLPNSQKTFQVSISNPWADAPDKLLPPVLFGGKYSSFDLGNDRFFLVNKRNAQIVCNLCLVDEHLKYSNSDQIKTWEKNYKHWLMFKEKYDNAAPAIESAKNNNEKSGLENKFLNDNKSLLEDIDDPPPSRRKDKDLAQIAEQIKMKIQAAEKHIKDMNPSKEIGKEQNIRYFELCISTSNDFDKQLRESKEGSKGVNVRDGMPLFYQIRFKVEALNTQFSEWYFPRSL
jgi:hypothetical protein